MDQAGREYTVRGQFVCKGMRFSRGQLWASCHNTEHNVACNEVHSPVGVFLRVIVQLLRCMQAEGTAENRDVIHSNRWLFNTSPYFLYHWDGSLFFLSEGLETQQGWLSGCVRSRFTENTPWHLWVLYLTVNDAAVKVSIVEEWQSHFF